MPRRKGRGQAGSRDVRTRILDPYLADAMQDYERVLRDLKRVNDLSHVEENSYLLCELSRDIMIRLLPFSKEMSGVISRAAMRFKKTLELLVNKPGNEHIAKYARNIQKRIVEFECFLPKH